MSQPCRSHARRRHTTVPEHTPSAHRRYAEWTPARMRREAAKIGPATIAFVEAIMKAKSPVLRPRPHFPHRLGHLLNKQRNAIATFE
jgi:hypothetical protein